VRQFKAQQARSLWARTHKLVGLTDIRLYPDSGEKADIAGLRMCVDRDRDDASWLRGVAKSRSAYAMVAALFFALSRMLAEAAVPVITAKMVPAE
jgi:hypothetical protein